MFQPNTNFSSSAKKAPTAKNKQQQQRQQQQQQQKCRPTDAYPSTAPPPSSVAREIRLSESRSTPVSSLSVSSCGAHVACGVTDYSVTIVGESLAEKTVSSHAGHKGVIHGGNWSLDGAWLVR